MLGVIVVVSACSGEGSLSTATATDPLVATSVAGGEPAQAALPTSTGAPTQTTAVIESPSAFSEASQQAVGVVVAVDGDLSEVRGFSVLALDGAVLELVPQAGLLFDGGPLSHLRDHLVSGAPVAVEYHVEAGVAVATGVGDAP